jgi:hypothetical protein
MGSAIWLKNYEENGRIYEELILLESRYRNYKRMHVESVLQLTHILNYTMPEIKSLLKGWNEANGKN